jgi:hypothetical protein
LLALTIGTPPAKKVTDPPGPWAKLVVVKVAVSATGVPSATPAALEVTVPVAEALVTVIALAAELLAVKLPSPPYCAVTE